MKKHLFIVFLMLSSLTTFGNARFFLGIDGGYSMDRIDTQTDEVLGRNDAVIKPKGPYIKNAYKGNGYLFNLNLGTEHHFDTNQYIGLRWFLGLGYGRTTLMNQANTNIKYPSNIIEAKLGLDLLLDVIKFGNNSLGLFGGIEGGLDTTLSDATYLREEDKRFSLLASNFVLSPRIGLSLFLAQHHRIEFVAKIPVYQIGVSHSNEESSSETLIYHPTQFMIGYKFVF